MKLLACAAAVFLTASAAAAEVNVTIKDGLVTIAARDVTTRQILAEWARVGQVTVVDGDRLPGGPTSIEMTDVPEAQALDLLLRSAAGYVAAPRAVAAAHLSRFDRVVVLPTSNAPRTAAVAAAPALAPPAFQQPQFVAAPVPDEEPEETQPNVQAPPNGRGPVFGAFPQPQVINPQTGAPVTAVPGGFPQGTPPQQQPTQEPQPTTFATPSSPFGGVAVPGMVAPAPQPQAQPGQIAPPQPGQVRRPGGGGE